VVEFQWRLGLYRRLVGARVRAQLQYRLSFALDLGGTFLITFVDFLGIVVLFAHLPRLAGWSLPAVAFFYGTANMAFAISDLVVGHLDMFSNSIRTGAFDGVLVRPVGSLFQVIASDLALRRIGKALQGGIVLAYALSHLTVAWTPLRVFTLITMVITGAVIYSAIWVMGASIAFWTTEVREITNAFTYGGSFLASYPVNIFGGWTRRLLAFVVPMAFVSYFPGLIVLDRPDPLGAPIFLRYCTPLVALGLAVLAARIWRIGVGQYRSAGS
jgi:ABC-2 type transport system permease protein